MVPFSRWVARASSVARCAPQMIIPGKANNVETEKSKKDHSCCDGSTKVNWWETKTNKVTPTDIKAEITFRYVYLAFCICIWNLRITFLNKDILLAFINISSCVRWPRIILCLLGAFGFMIGPFLCHKCYGIW